MSRIRPGKQQQSRKGQSRSADGGKRSGRHPLSRTKLRRRINLAAGLVVALGIVSTPWWVPGLKRQGFQALADEGRTEMRSRVVTENSEGRGHDHSHVTYGSFPTSGAHSPTWVDPGVYTSHQSKARLVHALEHGNIVIYYDDPPDEVLDRLRKWTSTYDNQWSGIVVTPSPGLGESIILTAWTHKLRMNTFQPAVAAAFIDTYRGRGPENPVR